ncbi:hypothetical protein ACHBTE_34385 [Streptomyces sp. M41]|uniref:hypothetical protein n=1 Tax=Streptomyces sp. M41 TaxID=3059412 RepID=UPI00374D5256
MTEPLTLAALGGVALSEGIRFLYAQADQLLDRRRAPREEDATPELPAPDAALVDRFEPDLRALMAELAPQVRDRGTGTDADSDTEEIRRNAEALRRLLSAIHGTHIVVGQASPATVKGRIDVEEVAGYVAAVRARTARGSIEVDARAGRVEGGGEFVGLDVDTLG